MYRKIDKYLFKQKLKFKKGKETLVYMFNMVPPNFTPKQTFQQSLHPPHPPMLCPYALIVIQVSIGPLRFSRSAIGPLNSRRCAIG